MNFHKTFMEIATFTVLNGRPYVRGQRFLRSVSGSISLKLCTKKVKQIFDIIQNGGLAVIFDVNTLGAITCRTSPGFRSNLVQRDCIGGATCMPVISCLVSKVATEWPYLLFYPPPHSQG